MDTKQRIGPDRPTGSEHDSSRGPASWLPTVMFTDLDATHWLQIERQRLAHREVGR